MEFSSFSSNMLMSAEECQEAGDVCDFELKVEGFMEPTNQQSNSSITSGSYVHYRTTELSCRQEFSLEVGFAVSHHPLGSDAITTTNAQSKLEQEEPESLQQQIMANLFCQNCLARMRKHDEVQRHFLQHQIKRSSSNFVM